MRPPSCDSASIRLISSTVFALMSSARGSTPSNFVPAFASACTTRMIGPEEHDIDPVEDRQPQEHALGVGEGEVPRHDLTEHHVQEDHDPESDDDAQDVHHTVWNRERRQELLQALNDRGLRSGAETERADGDAELG